MPRYQSELPGSADMTGVKITAGEYNQAQASERLEACANVALNDAFERLRHRKSRLWFCTSVDHAETIAALLGGAGKKVGCVTAKTSSAHRAQMVAQFKAGELTDLLNVDVFTEGFDAPNVDAVILMRATASVTRYVQMVGRGFRPNQGKDDFLLLDYAGNILRHGFVDHAYMPDLVYKPKEDKEPPVKACPVCFTVVLPDDKACQSCGFVWPPPPPRKAPDEKLNDEPFNTDIGRVEFDLHTSRVGKESVKITYWCGYSSFSEWLFPEHGKGFMRNKAWQRFAQFGVGMPMPTTNEDAIIRLKDSPLRPSSIEVAKDGEYWRVNKLHFGGTDGN